MINPAYNKNILIFLLSSIGLIALPHAYHLPLPVFGFFAVLLVWRFLGVWQPQRLPKGLLLLLVSVGGLALLYSQHSGILGRDAGTSLFLIALGLKLMEIKSERDLYLVNYLAFIVAASQFLYEQSILMAAYILFVCCVLLATLVFINSYVANTRVALKKASVIIAQAIPMAIAIFILFPRVEAPRWLLFNQQQQAKTGLSDSMEPGSISDLGLSDELVFRVKFTGAIPPPQLRYWRGPVLSQTDGKRWTQAKDLSYQQRAKPTFSGTVYQYTLLMEPQDKNWVFALELPAALPKTLRQNAVLQLLSVDALNQRTEYSLSSYAQYNTGASTPQEIQQAKQLPAMPSYKMKQLVRQLGGFDSTPEVFIGQLLTHFRQQDFHYTLTPPLMENNPVETFLFETRYGFCSHYASAFVTLMRVANIPARVVTGYQGGELNAVGDFLEIKQAQAHAWAEVWLDKQGWIRVDPTAAIAPERIEKNIDINQLLPGGAIHYVAPSSEAQAAFNWLQKTRQLWGNVDYSWQRWVINYNNANQSHFLSSFGIEDFKDMVYWMGAIIAVIVATLSGFLLYQKPTTVDHTLIVYKRFLKKLAKAGFNQGVGEGARDFAERIKPKLPTHAPSIEEITEAYLQQRYGVKASAVGLQHLKTLVNHFKI